MGRSSRLHVLHAVAMFLLILSGLMLSSQSFRGTLADLRIYLRYAHIIGGIIFAVTTAAYIGPLTVKWKACAGQTMQKAGYIVFVFLAAGAFLTGVFLIFGINIETADGLSTLNWHKGLAIINITAVLYHSLSELVNFLTNLSNDMGSGNVDGGFQVDRRNFIRWSSVVAALFGGGVIANWLRGGGNENPFLNKATRFANCNQMEPPPSPNLGSVPPIGGGYEGKFEVFTVTKIPCANSDSWQFRLFGLVDQPLTLSWKEFLEIPRKVQISDFYCVTGWTVYHATYEGIPLSRFIDLAKINPQVRYVKFYSADGLYTSALSLEQAKMEDVMVAVLMDGEPIPSDLGGPARLIVPKMYAYKGVKWINAIEFIAEPHIGYWESRGYENDAWVKGKQF